jgi:hypothetical protein
MSGVDTEGCETGLDRPKWWKTIIPQAAEHRADDFINRHSDEATYEIE